MTVQILQIPPALLMAMAPHVSPFLHPEHARIDPHELAHRLATDTAQLWTAIRGDAICGAFLTQILVLDSGARQVNVFGLGGRGLIGWGQALSARMVEFARANDCATVTFVGRRALARAYGDLRCVGSVGENLYLWERIAQ